MKYRATRALFVLLCLPVPAGYAASLNKCVDSRTGEITYTNLRCGKFQQRESVDLDPPPVIEPVQVRPPSVTPAPEPLPVTATLPSPAPAPRKPPPATGAALPPLHLDTPNAGLCDTLAQQLGHVLDRMDAERRAPADQLRQWQEQVDTLKSKKAALGCF